MVESAFYFKEVHINYFFKISKIQIKNEKFSRDMYIQALHINGVKKDHNILELISKNKKNQC